jgi:tRNA/tmRNA/rRNA uracil-C5-methylase (TrmA/RlmC/RlmD family)
VRIRVVEDRKNWARAELLEVLQPAPERTAPPCPVATTCGGCDLQHVTPAGQRALKHRVVHEQLTRLGGFVDPPVTPTRAVGEPLGYRAHARLHADADGRLGFHRAGTNDVVPVDVCPVLSPAAQRLRSEVGDDSGAVELEVRADGVHGTTGGAVVLLPGPGPLDVPAGTGDLLLEQPDGRSVALRGDGHLSVDVAGITYGLPPGAFFQVSSAAAEALVEEVLDAVGDPANALVWDLYAGVGLFSLQLARAGAEVVAVEGDPVAAAAATTNAEANGLRVRVVAADVRTTIDEWCGPDAAVEPAEVVVLDPPRTGVGEATMRRLARSGPPEVVLVACDPASLARDAAALAAEGYRLEHVVPLDLFPMTHHVEAVARLRR